MDYWAGTFGLVVFALVETILFMWVFGSKKAWAEMNEGGDFKIPSPFYFVMKYITPVLLLCLLTWWFIKDAIPILLLENVEPDKVPYIWGSRILMLSLVTVILLMIRKAWKRRQLKHE
jgi:NSS family neurotransmitter:Na+ symporter